MFSCCSSWDLLQRSPLLDAPGESGSPGETSGPEESEDPTVVQVYQSGRAGCKGPGQGRLLLADARESFWSPGVVLLFPDGSWDKIHLVFFYYLNVWNIKLNNETGASTAIRATKNSSEPSRSPVVVRPVTPVVPVIVVLIRPFPWGDVVAVSTRAAVHVSVWAPIIVVLVAVLFVRVMSVSLPGLVAVAWIRVFTVPLPISSLCDETQKKISLKLKTEMVYKWKEINAHYPSMCRRFYQSQSHLPSPPKCRLLGLL